MINTLWRNRQLTQLVPSISNIINHFFNMNRGAIMRIHAHMVDKRVIREQPILSLMGVPMQVDHVSAEMVIIVVGSQDRVVAQEQRQFAELNKFASMYISTGQFSCRGDGAQLIIGVVVPSDQEDRSIQTIEDIHIIVAHQHVTQMIDQITRLYNAVPAFYYCLVHFFKRGKSTRLIKEVLDMVKMRIRSKKYFTHELTRPPLHS